MNKIFTRRRLNIVSMITVAILLANLIVIKLVNKSYAGQVPEKYDLREEIGTIVGDELQNNSKPQGSLKNATLIQLESHIKLGKKDGKYNSYTDEVLSKLSTMTSDINYNVKAIFPVYKETTSNGVKYYTNTEGKEATSEELKERRESLKHTIANYGGVIAYISNTGVKDGLNNSGKVCLSKDLVTAVGNQAVVIIGWDDNFSKDNFNDSCRPTTDGAFIAQSFDDIIYVSYEDIYVENNLRYIEEVDELKVEEQKEDKEEQNEEPKEEETKKPTEDPKKEDNKEDSNKEDNKEEKQDTTTEEPKETPTEEPENKVDPEPTVPDAEEPTSEPEPVKEPDVPTEVIKVETGNDDVLEVDTSSIKDTPVENTKPTTRSNTTPDASTDKNDTKTTDIEYVSNANMATSKLPQTGSNIETILIIAIVSIISITYLLNTLRNVRGIK